MSDEEIVKETETEKKEQIEAYGSDQREDVRLKAIQAIQTQVLNGIYNDVMNLCSIHIKIEMKQSETNKQIVNAILHPVTEFGEELIKHMQDLHIEDTTKPETPQ